MQMIFIGCRQGIEINGFSKLESWEMHPSPCNYYWTAQNRQRKTHINPLYSLAHATLEYQVCVFLGYKSSLTYGFEHIVLRFSEPLSIITHGLDTTRLMPRIGYSSNDSSIQHQRRRCEKGRHAVPSKNFRNLSIKPPTHYTSNKKYQSTGKTMIPPGFEPGTACVLDRSDNQLHHRTN